MAFIAKTKPKCVVFNLWTTDVWINYRFMHVLLLWQGLSCMQHTFDQCKTNHFVCFQYKFQHFHRQRNDVKDNQLQAINHWKINDFSCCLERKLNFDKTQTAKGYQLCYDIIVALTAKRQSTLKVKVQFLSLLDERQKVERMKISNK